MSRAAAVVRGNALFSLLFAMGAVLRVIVLVAYQPILMLQRDTYVYLDMALKAQSAPAGFRPPVYPLLFLKPLLVFGRLWIVAAAQHVLALALALLLYAALRRLGARPWVGAVGVAPLLLDAYQLDIEHYLLSEALCLRSLARTLGPKQDHPHRFFRNPS